MGIAPTSGKRTDETCDCDKDPVGSLRKMFVDIVQNRRAMAGQSPVMRPVFLKVHGIAHGYFETRNDIPASLRLGVFALARANAWIRFSSDTTIGQPDAGTTLGIAIKLFDVPGAKLTGPHSTHDFVLQNHDVFFVDDAKEMCEFTRAGVLEGDYGRYLASHPATQKILDEMQKDVTGVLDTAYWSVLPYALGSAEHVKYILRPIAPAGGDVDISDPHYLQTGLRKCLAAGDFRFQFLIQPRTNPKTMPLDQATVRWSEKESAPVHVADLVLSRQNIDERGQAEYGESLAFNPWNCLQEHAPQGSIAAARRTIYEASASQRRSMNGALDAEPERPRRPGPAPAAKDSRVVRAAIHPAIGIARVGNSENEFYAGPETLNLPPAPEGGYRDSKGALKRQAARFRIYGYNAAGEVVGELTSDNARIHWTAHVANRKAAWYQFQIALDIPEANSADPSLLRNRSTPNRASLVIDPGERSIAGKGVSGPAYAFDNGQFMGKPVHLGEIRTDEKGHLLFLGGLGKAGSHDGKPAEDFANNEGWFDDTSDGPISAQVSIDGRPIPVLGAWVVTAPPNYAPSQQSVRTMYDLMFDVFVRTGALTCPSRPSFTRHIQPLFERMSRLQWVNAGFAAAFGWNGLQNFSAPEVMKRLSEKSGENAEFRRTLANHFRSFKRDAWSPTPWPWIYGDAMNVPPVESARQHATVTDTQLQMLSQWADGDFEADFGATPPVPHSIDDLPLADRPAMLDEAALTFCLADAFHPGCELTWPMRHATLYERPFRIRARDKSIPEPNYGSRLTPDSALDPAGPLHSQIPGGLTRWMAVPWQTDTASCRSGYWAGYGAKYDPYLPTFWPARVPNQVLTEADYRIVVDTSRSLPERLAAFSRRSSWFRQLGPGGYLEQINKMANDISVVGIVVERPGVPGDMNFPATMEVEHISAIAPGVTRNSGTIVLSLSPSGETESQVKEAAERLGLTSDYITAGEIAKVNRFPKGLRRD